MAISKPSWLRLLLDRLNWDIFVWKVYVGDTVEGAIDWVIDKINLVLDIGYLAYDRATSAWDKAVQLAGDLRTMVYREVQNILARISTWWDQLYTWWEAKRTWIQDVIDAGIDNLRPWIDQARAAIAKVEAAWDSFRRDTLPGLIDIDRWTAFWGGKVATASDWWAARRQQVSDMIDTVVAPVRSEVNKHSEKLDLLKDLMTDPERWLLDRLESMIARFL